MCKECDNLYYYSSIYDNLLLLSMQMKEEHVEKLEMQLCDRERAIA